MIPIKLDRDLGHAEDALNCASFVTRHAIEFFEKNKMLDSIKQLFELIDDDVQRAKSDIVSAYKKIDESRLDERSS